MADRGDQSPRLSGPPRRHLAARRRRHGRQPHGRAHLRPDQSAHQAHPMTAEYLDASLPVPSTGVPPNAVQEFWASFCSHHGAVAGCAVIATVVLLAAFADLIAPHSPVLNDNAAFLKPPFWQDGGSFTYLLGTDAIGRDMLSRLIYGARLSLLIGVAVVALSVIVGTGLGLVAGFFRGGVEIAIMRRLGILLPL